MTVEEIVVQALARANAWLPNDYGGPRSLLYRRVGVRQRQLFTAASALNPDFFGTAADVDLDQFGAADVNDIAGAIPTPAAIQRITIVDPGTSDYVEGDEVNVVSLTDAKGALAPRMTLRSGILEAIGADLEGVVSLRVAYARQPALYGPTDKNTAVDLQSPHDELLVTDTARFVLVLAAPAPAGRAAALAELDAEEAMLLDDFQATVRGFAPTISRFTRPSPGATEGT